MRANIARVCTLIFVLGVTMARGAPAREPDFRAWTQDMLDAIAVGGVDVWRKYVDPEALYIDENARVLTRSELFAELTPLPPDLIGSLEIGSMKIQRLGDVAVVTHEDNETLSYFGQIVHTRYRMTSTWQQKPDGWRVIATQVSAVLDDPPVFPNALPKNCPYRGSYRLTAKEHVSITCDGDTLVAKRNNRPPATYRAEVPDVFFQPGQPRVRRIFLRNAANEISGFVDRREGHDIRWERE